MFTLLMVYKVLNQYLQPEWLNAAYHCTENFLEKEMKKRLKNCRRFVARIMHLYA
jgi:hypothetical protein